MEETEPTQSEPTAPTSGPETLEARAKRPPILGIFGFAAAAVLAVFLVQANGDRAELRDTLDARNAEVTRLNEDLSTANDQLDVANVELDAANAELDTAAGVQSAIVDFIAVSLTLGGGINERDGRCVAETMNGDMGTELLLRSSLAAAGLTPNTQDGGLFTVALTDAAVSCGIPLDAPSNATPVVNGSPLPAFAAGEDDPAVGMAAPQVSGVDFEGNQVQIGGSGRPTAIVFLAHWCPHCQREVPAVQAWLDATGGVGGVDVVSIATSTDSGRANYPPWEWLERESWTPPVLADDGRGTAMRAFGGTAFPFWVFLNSDGTVAARLAGSTDIAVLEDLIQSIAP